MIISIASGKGGTGKTTISTSLALSIPNVQLLDCDVEEPNAHIFIKAKIQDKQIVSVSVPEVNLSRCNFCGKCQEVCEYNSIAVMKDKVLVFPELCHDCGSCIYLCPRKALYEVSREIGIIETGYNDNIEFVHGKLNIGQVMSPPLIRAVKEKINPNKTVIIDAPPGTSCPVITAVKDTDYCVLVTEPTPFGLHDLKLSVETLMKMNIPFGVVINRSDLGDNKTEDYCLKENIKILMKIPFRKGIAVSYSKGIPMISAFPEYEKDFKKLFEIIKIKQR
jgi:MinD superfamily P-loop ATPase